MFNNLKYMNKFNMKFILSILLLVLCFFVMPTKSEAATIVDSLTWGSATTYTDATYGTFTYMPDSTGKYARITKCIPNSSTLVFPNEINGLKVIFLEHEDALGDGDSVMDRSTTITQLTLPESLEVIGYNAFYNCSNLKCELIIPNSMVEIRPNAFYNCSGLKGDLIIPNSVSKIEMYAFCGCTGLNGKLVLSENMSRVSSNSFEGCSGITGDLIIPDSVLEISTCAFQGCDNLDSIILPSTTNLQQDANNTCFSNVPIYAYTQDMADAYNETSDYSSLNNGQGVIGILNLDTTLEEIEQNGTFTDHVDMGYTSDSFYYRVIYKDINTGTTYNSLDTSIPGIYEAIYILRQYNEETGAYEDITTPSGYVSVSCTIVVEGEASTDNTLMITKWNIPAGTTIKLPVSGTGLNVDIDWGDGTTSEDVTTELPTHKYDTKGTYYIKVSGTCPDWGYQGISSVNSDSPYYTYTQYLTGVINWGELSATQYGFAYCEKLTEVSKDIKENTFKNVTDMSNMFMNCISLKSLDLINWNTSKVTNTNSMFKNCSELKTLHLGENFTKLNGTEMFAGCTNLKSIISRNEGSNSTPAPLTTLKVGDYVDYPVTYNNVDMNVALTGWRVLSVADDGTVKLVSAGIPLTANDDNTSTEITKERYVDNFLTANFTANGFDTAEKTLTQIFSNDYTLSVRAMMKEDLDEWNNGVPFEIRDIVEENDDNLILNGAYQWLISENNEKWILRADSDNSIYITAYMTAGLRPVVTLNSNVVVDTTDSTKDGSSAENAWKIEVEDTSNSNENVLKVGDYVSYTADSNSQYVIDSSLTGYSAENGNVLKPDNTVSWRVWEVKDDGSVVIMPTSPVNSVTLYNEAGYENGVSVIKGIEDLYTNSTLNITVDNIESLDYDDLINDRVIASTEDTYPIPKQYTTYKNIENNNFPTDTFGTLLGDNISWLATALEGTVGTGDTGIYYANSTELSVNRIWNADGGPMDEFDYAYTHGIRPLVTLPANIIVDTTDSTKNGSSAENAWVIKVSEESVLELSTDTGIEDITKLYVPNEVAEKYYEGITPFNTELGEERIEPILALIGEKDITINKNSTYVDAGATVAGFTASEDGNYTQYGYSLTVANDVVTDTQGEYEVTYKVTYSGGEIADMEVTRNVIVEDSLSVDESTAMVTKWNIPAGTTITLPVAGTGSTYDTWTNTDLNLIVDWGDGTVEPVTTANPTHYYETGKEYTIKVSGTCPVWGYADTAQPTTSERSKYYTYTQYLIGVEKFGELNTTSYGFSYCANLAYVSENSATANTFKNVTDMSCMFYFAGSSATTVNWNLSGWNTLNVTNMGHMFECAASSATTVNFDLSNWDTSSVTNMSNMFNYAVTSATTFNLNLSNWDTSSVTDMSYMFSNAGARVTTFNLDLSSFDTSNVTAMEYMLGCDNRDSTSILTNLQISNKFVIPAYSNKVLGYFPTLKVIIITSTEPNGDQLSNIKSELPSGTTIYVPNGYEAEYRDAFGESFSEDKIKPILEVNDDLNVIQKGEDYTEPSYTVAGYTAEELKAQGVNNENLFGYNVVTTGDVDTDNVGVYPVEYSLTRTYTAADGTKVTTEPIIETGEVVVEEPLSVDESTAMVTKWNIPAGTTITLPVAGTGSTYTSWTNTDLNIIVDWGDGKVEQITTANPTHYYETGKEYTIKVSGTCPVWGYAYWVEASDTYGTEVYYTYTQYLTGIEKFGELNATSYGFSYCVNLAYIAENSATTNTFKNVTSMFMMFYYASTNVTTLNWNLSGWDTSSVINMSNMFESVGGTATTTFNLDLSDWNTSNVTNMYYMFKDAGYNLTTFNLNLSGWDTSNVTNMNMMFDSAGCDATTWSILISNKFKFIVYYDPFDVLGSEAYVFSSLPSNAKIILTSNDAISDQFAEVSSEVSNVTFYVPNDGLTDYRNTWTSIADEKIQPILGITKGDITISQGETFVDTTYVTVAGYDESVSESYTVYGYNVEKIGNVVTSTPGTYPLTYKLTRTYSGDTITEDVASDTRNVIVEGSLAVDESTAMVTKWNIPAGTTITLPVAGTGSTYERFTNADLNVIVDWGDGTVEPVTTANPTHYYAIGKEYTIKVSGTCPVWGYAGTAQPTTSERSKYYTYTQRLTEIVSWGNMGETSYGFAWCQNLTGDLVIPNSITSIGDYAFFYCTGFTGSLTISNSVTSIGSSAFQGCSGLKGNLIIGNSVTNIENNAFCNCSGLTGDLVIPDSVTTIGYGAFSDCSGFTGNLVIGNKIEGIDPCAFNNCSGMTGGVILPETFTGLVDDTYVYDTIFNGCSNVDYVVFTRDLSIPNLGYGGTTGIPSGKAYGLTSKIVELYNTDSNWLKENGGIGLKPLLALAKTETETIAQGSTFVDDGVTVAGFLEDPNGNFRAKVSYVLQEDVAVASLSNRALLGLAGDTLNTNVPGTYLATYTLQRYNEETLAYENVTDSQGNKEQVSRTIVVEGEAPTITSQPSNVSANINTEASFSITAEGENLTYLWQYRDAGDAYTWTEVPASMGNGVTTDTLVIPNVLEEYDGYEFRCIVTGETDAISNVVTLHAIKDDQNVDIETETLNYKVNDKQYETIAEAYGAIEGTTGEIIVLKDYSDSTELKIEEDKEVILNTNGKTLTLSRRIGNDGKLIINGDGIIQSEKNTLTYLVSNGGELILNSSTLIFNGNTTEGYALRNKANGSFIMNGGEIRTIHPGDGENLCIMGEYGSKTTINDGIVRTIVSGEIAGKIRTIHVWADLEINGGKISIEGNAVVADAISVVMVEYAKLDITSGEIGIEGNLTRNDITDGSHYTRIISIVGTEFNMSDGLVFNEYSNTLDSYGSVVAIESESTFNMTGGVISGDCQYGLIVNDIDNTINIESGMLAGTLKTIRIGNSDNIVNVGKESGEISTTDPVIIGEEYALKVSCPVYFYDGVFKGKSYVYEGNLIPEDGYEVREASEDINGVKYYTAKLQEALNTPNAMITEWTISGDNTTIKLPVQGDGLHVDIDWGDGTTSGDVTTAFPEHKYEEAGTYYIKVKGICPEWGYNAESSVNSDSPYYTYTLYLTGLQQWGELQATKYGFAYCGKLTYVSGDATDKTFEKVTDMSLMFFRCTTLASIDLSDFDTSNVTNMYGLFAYCNSLTSLDVSAFDTLNVMNMRSMFYHCISLKNIIIGNIDTKNVTTMQAMFSNCKALEELDLSKINTSSVTSMMSMFYECNSLIEINLNNLNTQKVIDMNYMFYNCSTLINLDLNSFDTSNVTNMEWMFYNCRALTSLDLSNFNTQNVTNMEWMFYNCRALTSLDLSNFNTQNVTTMNSMFCDCLSLKELDVSSFNTSKVTNMAFMFGVDGGDGTKIIPLESLDVSGFDTSKVTTMNAMFQCCTKLKTLDVSKWNTENVTNMKYMFNHCESLTYLDVSGFKTDKVTTMKQMFALNEKLKSIDVSNFNTSKVADMYGMFGRCISLTNLDLSSFDTSKVTNMIIMFKDCQNLKSALISNKFIVSGDTADMFTDCNPDLRFITTSSTPVANQFKGTLPSTVKLYVPNDSLEAYIQTLTGDTPRSQIKAVLSLSRGDEIITVGKHFADVAEVYVADFSGDDAKYYTCYDLSTIGSGDVNTDDIGTYKREYLLMRDDTEIAKTSRNIIVEMNFAPENFTAIGKTDASITLSFTKPIHEYPVIIEMLNANGEWTLLSNNAASPFEKSGLKENTSYEFRAYSINARGEQSDYIYTSASTLTEAEGIIIRNDTIKPILIYVDLDPEEVYIDSGDAIRLTFTAEDIHYYYPESIILANDIVVKVGGNVSNTAIKDIVRTNIASGERYDVVISNIDGIGDLSVIILENSIMDKAGNGNGETKFDLTPIVANDSITDDAPTLALDESVITVTNNQESYLEIATIKYQYRIQGETEFKTTTSNMITNTASAKIYEVRTVVTDVAGNTKASQIATITTEGMDNSLITITADTETLTSGDVTVTINFGGSKYGKEYSLDNTTWNKVSSDETKITITENKTVYARFKDANGNATDSITYVVDNIDKAKPVIGSLTLPEGNANYKDIVLSGIEDVGIAGILGYYVNTVPDLSKSTWTEFTGTSFIYRANENATYYIWVADKALNISEAKIVVVTGIVDAVTNISVPTEMTLSVGEEKVIPISYDGEAKRVEITATDGTIVSVQESIRTITGLAVGETNVTVTIKDYTVTPDHTYTIKVTVTSIELEANLTSNDEEYNGEWTNKDVNVELTTNGVKPVDYEVKVGQDGEFGEIDGLTINDITGNGEVIYSEDFSGEVYFIGYNGDGKAITKESQGKVIKIDKTEPEMGTLEKNIGTNSVIVTVANARDNLSGIKEYEIGIYSGDECLATYKGEVGEATFSGLTSSTTYGFKYKITDNAGNQTELIDGGSITTGIIKKIVTYDYQTNGGDSVSTETDEVVAGTKVNLTIFATKSGYNFKGWSLTKDGEVLESLVMPEEDITLYAIFKDETSPVVTNKAYKTIDGKLQLTLHATDEGSGVKEYAVTTDEGTPNEWAAATDGDITITVPGTNRYNVWIRDGEGNYARYEQMAIKDIFAPTGTLEVLEYEPVPGGLDYSKTQQVTLSITADDNETADGEIQIAIYNEADYINITSYDQINFAYTYKAGGLEVEFTTTNGDGLRKIYVIFKDKAGNISMTVGAVE